jgi:hypothetical protein
LSENSLNQRAATELLRLKQKTDSADYWKTPDYDHYKKRNTLLTENDGKL